jgi:hypothetical protein
MPLPKTGYINRASAGLVADLTFLHSSSQLQTTSSYPPGVSSRACIEKSLFEDAPRAIIDADIPVGELSAAN